MGSLSAPPHSLFICSSSSNRSPAKAGVTLFL
ncbi:hypothetical protein E2C01_086883 [Portunus trituberculatus]|uniref:Uncharacterized protein n=1 Tax=Portunus trituberculatus TaxID=210409 RepID=A0A5B7JBS3_PORTR|nr:hypothetical protein [Portunus trituberculatus]